MEYWNPRVGREEPFLHRSGFPIHVHGPVFMALCRLSRVPWSEVEGQTSPRCSGYCYDSENANLTFTPSFVLAFFPCLKYTQPQMHVLIAEGEVNTVEVP